MEMGGIKSAGASPVRVSMNASGSNHCASSSKRIGTVSADFLFRLLLLGLSGWEASGTNLGLIR